MASKKVLVIALAHAAFTAQSDNCNQVDSVYQLRATLTGLFCTSSDLTCSKDTGCDCAGTCCTPTPGTCEANTASCDATSFKDSTKRAATAATGTYQANCCTAKAACSTITCDSAAHKKDKSDKATLKCGSGTCTEAECCDIDYPDTVCGGLIVNATVASKGCDQTTQMADSSKLATAATVDTFKATCCLTKALCADHTCAAGLQDKTDKATSKCSSATCSDRSCCDALCSAHTCSAGFTDKTDKATRKCSSATCTDGSCCDTDPNTCKGNTQKTPPQTCTTANSVYKSAADTTAVMADSSNFNSVCCEAKATCAAFAAQTLGTANAAKSQQAPAMALLMAIGVFVWRK